MPIFNYVCEKCRRHFERLLSRSEVETETVNCEECKVPATKMLSTFSNYHIKGNNSASTRPKFTRRTS